MDLATYTQWIARGRHVRAGERAQFYAVEIGGERRLALFDRDQTEEHLDVDWSAWTILATTDLPTPDKRPKLTVDLDPEGFVRLWCGPDKDVIGIMQRREWRFDPKTAKWVAPHKDTQIVVKAFRERGYNVRLVDVDV